MAMLMKLTGVPLAAPSGPGGLSGAAWRARLTLSPRVDSMQGRLGAGVSHRGRIDGSLLSRAKFSMRSCKAVTGRLEVNGRGSRIIRPQP